MRNLMIAFVSWFLAHAVLGNTDMEGSFEEIITDIQKELSMLNTIDVNTNALVMDLLVDIDDESSHAYGGESEGQKTTGEHNAHALTGSTQARINKGHTQRKRRGSLDAATYQRFSEMNEERVQALGQMFKELTHA